MEGDNSSGDAAVGDEAKGEAGCHARFYVFRVHGLEQRLAVSFTCVRNQGSAVAGVHFIDTTGVVIFEPGASLASFDIPICDDDAWEPIRDFSVRLVEVCEGRGVIGALSCCTCSVVDDDVYPRKEHRTGAYPLKHAERIVQSCVNVDKYLTPDEIDDFKLLRNFLLERWAALWPHSGWATVWSVYRALYHVGMALVVMLSLDFVWQPRLEPPGEAPDGDRDMYHTRMILAVILSVSVVIATVVQSYTETWIVVNAKCGLTGKQLRDWIATQLVWADDSRLAMMRNADYLNAATSEVESVAGAFEHIFKMIQTVAHFCLNLVLMIVYVDIPTRTPVASLCVLSLIPVTHTHTHTHIHTHTHTGDSIHALGAIQEDPPSIQSYRMHICIINTAH